MLFLLLPLLASLLSCAFAAKNEGGHEIRLENRQGSMPILTLDYGRYQASNYDAARDIYTFKNIRFAAPPTGNLRWRAPQKPAYNDTLQDGSYGNKCIQGAPRGLNLLGPLNQLQTPAGIINGFIGGVLPVVLGGGDEDCLFLDLYVPGKAINDPSGTSLPVVVWVYGGAYVFGDKNQAEPILPLYDGTGPMQEANNGIIFLSFNYRLGSLGFLAGTTMEQDGLPNAGYYDQRAVFQWVQDYIHLVGGDKTQVTAWGESAGAGSILGQLTAFGGKQDPLFRKAVMQSIASEALVDRRGDAERLFKDFATYAGCQGKGLDCLRTVPMANLIKANTKLVRSPPLGAFYPGPTSDGAWVRQPPALELQSGNYWKDMDALILSHVSEEPTLFVSGDIDTDSKFKQLVNFIIPSYAKVVLNKVVEFFPSPSAGSNYTTQTSRVEDYLGTTNFYCNYRYLTNAYAGKTWNLQYSVTPGYHATDLLPTFNDGNLNITNLTIPIIPGFGGLSLAYQSYLTSLSITGDPNTQRRSVNVPPAIEWPHPTNINDEMLGNVLDTGDTGFSIITDEKALKSKCDFFLNVQAAIVSRGGYSPPGSFVPNNLGVGSKGNPSRNYATP